LTSEVGEAPARCIHSALAIPRGEGAESIRPIVVMDSGLALRAPWNDMLHLLVPGGRLSALALLLLLLLLLLLPLLLIGAMAAVEASGGSTEHAVTAGKVTGDAADHGAFQTALGVGRWRRD
jgi:hypothetical protein